MRLYFLGVFGILFLFAKYGNGFEEENPYQCTCASSHPQQLFCDSHFALRGVVTSDEPYEIVADVFENGKEVRKKISKMFELTVIRVYRGIETLLGIPITDDQSVKDLPSLQLTAVNITTPYDEEACGINLDVGTQYLIFGTRNEFDQLETKLCNFFAEWDEVEDQTRRGILGDYDCRCRVETGITLKDEIPDYKIKKNNTCVYNISPSELVDECAMNFLTCRKLVTPIRGDGVMEQCVWVEGKEFNQCRIPV